MAPGGYDVTPPAPGRGVAELGLAGNPGVKTSAVGDSKVRGPLSSALGARKTSSPLQSVSWVVGENVKVLTR